MTIKKFFLVLYGAFFVMLIALGFMSSLLNRNQADVERNQETRHQTYLLAYEFRQNVDDLTSFARNYVVTGEPRYEQLYRDVLAVREGHKPRPNGQSTSLTDLMKKSGFTAEEVTEINEAKSRTENLLKIEEKAFLAMKGQYDDGTGKFKAGKPDQALAIQMLHDNIYQLEKLKAMAPINDFIFNHDLQTKSMLEKITKRGKLYLNMSIGLLILLSAIVVISLITINRKVNAPIRRLQEATQSVNTDLSQLTAVATGLANGDLSRTAEIQTQPLAFETKDEMGNLAQDFSQMIAQLRETGEAYAKMGETVKSQIADVNMLVQAAVEGNLTTRADASKHQGEFRKIVQGINGTLDAVTGPLHIAAEYIKRISVGDLPP